MIWKMNFSAWRKVQIVGVFAMGFMSTAAAATRVYIMWQDAYGTLLFRNLVNILLTTR
jgi:hypothetical protein